ncbi:MAG: C25 family cysteine peptidase, partial [Acidobacteriota bacterium]|nr:C25 family cysteine peptidase [Acidobacteriota bacterium]
MKSTRNLNFRFSIVFVAVYALLLTSFPFAVSAQKTESITPGPGVSIREKVVFNDQSVAAFTDNTLIDSARGSGRGKKSPPSETPTNAQWDIAGKDGVKFYTNQDAWYRLSANQLQEYGFDISSDPGKWQLFADGVEVPMVVGTDMSIEFFGAAVDTPQTDSKVYFLTVGDTPGARIDSYWAGNTGQKPDVDSFNVKVERKDRQLYFTGILNGESENWFGSIVSSTAANLDLDLTNVRENGQPSLEVRVQGITTQSHLISVRVNDYDLGVISFAGKTLHQQSFAIPQSVIIEGTNQFTLQAIGAGSDFSVVDALSVTYARSYQAINDKLNFGVDRGQSVRVDGFSENGLRVYEISGGRAIGEIDVQPENNNGTFGFGIGSSNLDREFIAVTSSAALTPHRIEKNVPSAWNAASNAAAFLIVSPGAFAGQAQSLADRRISQGMNTKVVLTEDIGDEFGYGIITDVALYDFFAHARTYWREKPQAILLFGDSSFDMRNYSGGANRNLVPTKLIETFDMETSSDGWLVDFDKDGVEDVPIGRLPVADTLEAAQAVAKIVRYETQNLDEPRSALLAADYYFEILNGYLEALLPSTVSSQRVQ